MRVSWFERVEMGDTMAKIMVLSFSDKEEDTYAVYQPVHSLIQFDIRGPVMVCGYAVLISAAAAGAYYCGLRRYTSGNLMEARM